MRWLRAVFIGAALAGAGAACSFGGGSTPTVLVDFSHDEFASQFISYFPSEVKVHPGDTVTFKQTWTGEPHTVTLGSPIATMLEVTQPLIEEYGHLPDDEVPEWVFEEYFGAMAEIPFLDFSEDEEEGEGGPDEVSQVVAQPCLVISGEIPDDLAPCEVQELGPFEGTEVLYNSGVIPFEGRGQNRFDLILSDTIAPGRYPYVCAIHGAFQSGVIEVVPPEDPIPTPREVSMQARAEIDEAAGPMLDFFRRARDEGVLVLGGTRHEGNFAGLITEPVVGPASGQINEFVPKTVSVAVGEPVTWRMFGGHSIAFDVPAYFPIVEFAEDGTVTYNEAVHEPAGGAPPLPDHDDGPPPPGPMLVDGGTWDGQGFYSTGTLWSDEYVEVTLRFSTPGTYPYACLIHPPMVGTVRVND